MVGPAHRAFRARFERLVDPEGNLDPVERTLRADRARRAHMLSLAAKSAESRRLKKAAAAIETPATATEGRRHARVDRPSPG